MGGAQSARNLVVAGVGDRRSHRGHRHQRAEHSRNRHHQPARDDNRVGPRNGGTGLQRHRMAGPPDLGVLRLAEGRRKNRVDSRKDGPDHRRLFQRHEDQMDSGQRAGRAGAGREGQADVRNGRHMADLAADARRSARDRPEQRLTHDAVQHPHAAMGRGVAEAVRHPGVDDARGALVERGLRSDENHDLRPQSPHRGYRRRPAGGPVRTDVRRAGIGEKHLRHGLLPADEQRRKAHRLEKQPADDHRLEDRRQGQLRPRREHLRRRIGGAVAARRAGRWRRWRRRFPTPEASTSCPR